MKNLLVGVASPTSPLVGLLLLVLFLSSRVAMAVANNNNNMLCDETKCRATRKHGWVDGETEYTCWVNANDTTTTNSSNTNLSCADGYEGRIIPKVPWKEKEEGDEESQQQQQLQWYTCCPPGTATTIAQQCSDLACSSPDWEGGGNCWADGFQEPMSCSSSEFRYPRKTGLLSLIYIQYLCCTTPTPSNGHKYSHFMEELLVARIIWMVLSGITFCTCLVFILGLLSSKKVRSQGYNLYLLFLAIPDAIANLFILIRNGLTISGVPVSPTVHIFLASFEYFYATSNMWLNGVIVGQVHRVLRKTRRCVRVAPPSVATVCAQAAAVYLFAGVGFAWSFFLYYRGLVLFDLDAVVPIWIATRAVIVAPPLFYVVYVCFDVWYKKLLPKGGRTRVLSLYFLRVIVVFFVTWVPYFVLYEIAWNVTHSRWMVFVSYYLGSIQGFLSVMVALGKPDIQRAVVEFVCCSCVPEKRLQRIYGSWTAKFTSSINVRSQFSSAADEINPAGPPATTDPDAPVVVGRQDVNGDSNSLPDVAQEGVDAEAPVPEEGGGGLRVDNTLRTPRSGRRSSLLESYQTHLRRKNDSWETEDIWESQHLGDGGIDQIQKSSDDDSPPQENGDNHQQAGAAPKMT